MNLREKRRRGGSSVKTFAKKIVMLIALLTLIAAAEPKPVSADGGEFGYEIVVEPSPVTIGDEVTLTVRLTDYDETKAGIRGFQIDINNNGNLLQNSTCTTLVTDNEGALSNYTSYQSGRDLVRHLYMKMNGTLDRSQSDLLEVKIPIPHSFTEEGTVTLPFRLLIQSDAEENNQLTYNSTIEIHYVPEGETPVEPVTSVDISWGEMNFTYTDGTWNPTEHQYEGAGWTDNGSGYVTVRNNGEKDVETSFAYASGRSDISGGFTDGTNPVTAPVSLGAGKEQTVYLVLSGKPEGYLGENAVIGTVNIILGGE